jgi:alkanesulfonate monooxygenase SsuD/methylene tetrahydromethanopterin reductase-like flavin-dependent oxidoreductase (luciferase family)
VYLAAMGPRNVALAAEIADGWMPLLYAPDHADVFADPLREGAALRDPGLDELDVAPMVWVAAGDDPAACRDAVRPSIALYVGAYGSKGANFYHALVARYGYGAEADHIQELMLAGKRAEAVAAVPDALVDEVALVGPVARIAERMQAFHDAGVTTMVVQTTDAETMAAVAAAAERGGVA